MRTTLRALAILLPPALCLAHTVEIPVTNWTVPPYGVASGGLSTMTDFSPPRVFVAVTPCRVVDTRNPNGPFGGPPLLTNASRTFDIDNGPCAGIPAGVEAYSLSFGAILPPADGFLTAWPTGTAQPLFSQVNLIAGEVVANAAIVPAGTNGAINVLVNIGPTHVYIDINGYFADTLGSPGNSLSLTNNAPGGATASFANSANSNMSTGVLGLTGPALARPSNYFASGVRGEGTLTGVLGVSQNLGVAGSLLDGSGGELAYGILGFNDSTFRNGVYGLSYGDFGVVGVHGSPPGPTVARVGVLGAMSPRVVLGSLSPVSGVLGVSTTTGNIGVAGFGNFGVKGQFYAPPDTFGAAAWLGLSASQGLSVSGNAHVAGTFTALFKSFVQPHPQDASKEIRYVSLEGPASEVYFRGTAQVSQGVTRISIPEHFRFVADPATYSTLVTPVGDMATVAVVSEGPDGIVIRASRNVRVHYVVYAEREAIRNPDPIIDNVHFRSDGDRDFLAFLPDSFRRLMIQNGTLKPDGTWNEETARRLGWDNFEPPSRSEPSPSGQ